MKKQISLLIILAVMLPLTVHASEFKITETDSSIVVEYVGEPDATVSNSQHTAVTNQTMTPSPVAAMPTPQKTTAKATPAKPKPTEVDDAAEPPSALKIEKAEARLARAKLREFSQAARAERAARNYKAPSSSDPYFPPSFEDR